MSPASSETLAQVSRSISQSPESPTMWLRDLTPLTDWATMIRSDRGAA